MSSHVESCSETISSPHAARVRKSSDDITLQPVTVSDRSAIEQLVLDPEQEQFAGSVATIFEELQDSEEEHPFAIVTRGKSVGFFILREKHLLPLWAPDGVITLHSFRICNACQRRGFGRAGVELAISWIAKNRPGVARLMLAVNARNLAARSTYLKCGFVDTGEIFPGPIGNQHILGIAIPH